MNPILEDVFKTKQFKNSKGEIVNVHSETKRAQCEFLQQIIKDSRFSKSIEIGFAFGTSTLAIVEQISQHGGKHVVIDKYQRSGWGSNGLDLIDAAGYKSKLEFHEEFCYEILPKLLIEGRKFDFAYVDSTKQFDWILVDFFYLDKLLEINGVIVFDDVFWPSIRKVLRYISQFPNYEVYAQYPNNVPLSKSKKLATFLAHLPYTEKLLKEDIILPDTSLKINSSCVALRKIGNDNRKWDWHVSF